MTEEITLWYIERDSFCDTMPLMLKDKGSGNLWQRFSDNVFTRHLDSQTYHHMTVQTGLMKKHHIKANDMITLMKRWNDQLKEYPFAPRFEEQPISQLLHVKFRQLDDNEPLPKRGLYINSNVKLMKITFTKGLLNFWLENRMISNDMLSFLFDISEEMHNMNNYDDIIEDMYVNVIKNAWENDDTK